MVDVGIGEKIISSEHGAVPEEDGYSRIQNGSSGDFPGGPVAKTSRSQ